MLSNSIYWLDDCILVQFPVFLNEIENQKCGVTTRN